MQGAAAQLRVDEAAYSGQLHAAFAELVRERCVERCRPCDMPRVSQMVSVVTLPRRDSGIASAQGSAGCMASGAGSGAGHGNVLHSPEGERMKIAGFR